jgi:protein gp37
MAQNSKIEWTHHTANLWHGCTKVHEGCNNCYAEKLSHRWGNDVWGDDKARKEIKSFFSDLDKYQNIAKSSNETHRVFVGSMMDIFEKSKTLINSKSEISEYKNSKLLRDEFFLRIQQCRYLNLEFLFLTKRPSNINNFIPYYWKTNPPKNVIFGTSISTQEHAQRLINMLVKVNGKRFLSIEPQLTEIKDIDLTGIDWVIQGGESGHGKRPFNIDWAYTMRDICKAKNVPYFFKQIDKIQEIPEDLMIREFP